MNVRFGFMCETREQLEYYALSCMAPAIPFLGIVYNNVCLKGFGTAALPRVHACSTSGPCTILARPACAALSG